MIRQLSGLVRYIAFRASSVESRESDMNRIMTPNRRSRLNRREAHSFLAIPFGVVLGLGLAGSAYAEGDAVDGAELWNSAGCFACHGDLADGGGDAANAAGPSLRSTRLDRDELTEVIACGADGMPAHLIGAYVDHACYGEQPGAVPLAIIPSPQFTEEQLVHLVDFLTENVVGQRVNRANCALFFDGNENHPVCLQF